MILSPEDAALFYRAWGALLTWVNEERNIVPPFSRPTPDHPIAPALAYPIRNVLWAEDPLRERFLAEAASDLGEAERDLIASWRHRVGGSFVVLKHLQKHSIFMSKGVYAVLGIYTPFAEMFPHVPKFVDAMLIPFRDAIITDGLLQSPPMQIGFGAGARRSFEDQYRKARASSEVRTSLQPQQESRSTTPILRGQPSRPKPNAARSGELRRPSILGLWRITKTELWELDADEPAFIRFDSKRLGVFGILAVEADLDCRYGERDGRPLVEFTFEGDDDGHPRSGRGWAVIETDDVLRGRFFIHHGDESDFVAERVAERVTPRRRTRPR